MSADNYKHLKVRPDLYAVIKRCKLPGESLSDTLKWLMDPTRVYERQKQAELRDRAEKEGG